MNFFNNLSRRASLVSTSSLLFCLAALVSASGGAADMHGPGWFDTGPTPALTLIPVGGTPPSAGAPESAAVLPSGWPTAVDADFATEEIAALARGLGHDPLRIFNFVRNNVRYEHYYGSKKGAALTLLERSGNDFDQCSLLVSLLREAAVVNTSIGAITYQYGTMFIPLDAETQRDSEHWLGIADASMFARATYSGGWPHMSGADRSVYWTNGVTLARVCVAANLAGTSVTFDPSFKGHTETVGININEASGYNQAALLLAASGSSTATQVSGMNPVNLAAHLGSLTSNLVNSIEASPATRNASMEQVVGGRVINRFDSADFSTTSYFEWIELLETWQEIPVDKATVVELSIPAVGTAQSVLSWKLGTADLRGRRLSLTFAATAPKRAQIWLDDNGPLAEETGTASGAEVAVVTSIYHPFRGVNANQSDALGQLTYQRSATVGATTFPGRYAIVYAFDAGADHVRHRQDKLAAYRAAGLADNTREVRTETLNLMGLQWLRQSALAKTLIDRATDCVRLDHHSFGRVCQTGTVYVDIPLLYGYLRNRQGDEQKVSKAFQLGTIAASAFEHGVIEQVQNVEAVSTVDLITRALAGGTVNRIVDGERTTLRPAASLQTVGSWSGTGYMEVVDTPTQRMVLMAINGPGALNGGSGTQKLQADSTESADDASSDPNALHVTPGSSPLNYGADPVDLATGAFTYDHVDLALGRVEPRGLVLSRHYNSRMKQRNDAQMGFGWTHGYHLRVTKRTDGEVAFGAGTPAEAAAALVAVHVALDVYDITDPKKWACSMLALGWSVDQADENAVAIQIGERSLQFVRLPGGGFLSPPGLPVSLLAVAGGYEMKIRHGNTVVFDANGRGTKVRDAYGNESTLTYNTNGTLQTVKDRSLTASRTLTFTYTLGKLTTVADGTGRSVVYTQDAAKDLTAYTDAEGKVWGYQYLSGHALEKMLDPDLRVITKNIFDGAGRVKEQLTHGDLSKKWELLYSHDSTTERDALGGTRTLLFDDQHRLTAEVDAGGRRSAYGYDGQNHRTSTTTPKGETTTTLYDSSHNPLVTTDPQQKTTQFFYDSAERLDYMIDRRGKTWDVSFNSFHQPWKSSTPEGVETELIYYPSGAQMGLLWKRIVEGIYTTTYEYDTYGSVSKITHPNGGFESFSHNPRGDLLSHTDLRGFITSFQYNKRRQLTVTTLPTVNGNAYTLENVYDNSGNLWKEFDRHRNLTTHTYSATQKRLVTTFADGETIGRVYDARDWLAKTVDALGGENRVAYHPDGRLHRTFDRLNRQQIEQTYDINGRSADTRTPQPNAGGGWSTTTNSYTSRGELWKAQDAKGLTEFNHDENGNLRFRKNRRDYTWEFTYNDDNQPEDSVSPLAPPMEKRYDARGLLNTVKEPSGQVTTYTPDSLGRVDAATDGVSSIDLSYDAESRVDTIQESTAGSPLIDRNYDALGRLIRYQHGADYTVQWIFHDTDAVNKNAFSLQYPDGKLVRYDVDNRGRLATIKDWNGRLTSYAYDDLGRLEWTTRPNGTKRHVTYDAASQISRIEEIDNRGWLIAVYGYPAYWDNGQPRQQFSVPLLPGSAVPSAAMTFDAENRVTSWNGTAVIHDSDGNLIEGPLPAMSAGVGSPGFGAFAYDARNRLLSCNNVSYTYDAENLRTKVTTGAGTTDWVINPMGAPAQPLLRTKPNGTVTRYVWGIGLLYEEDQATSETSTYHYDRRGSTVALSAGDGRTLTARWAYGAYGERLSQIGSSDTPFQFNGFFGVQTDSSGLLYMNARYYNVELRRFVSADPMGFAESANFYWFANGDPFLLADPFGLGASDMSEGFFDRLVGVFKAAFGLFAYENKAANEFIMSGLDYAGLVNGPYSEQRKSSLAHTNPNLSEVNLWIEYALSIPGAGGGLGSIKTAAIADDILRWLGPNSTRPLNTTSDLFLRSADGTKQIRFDLSHPHGLEPHINLETFTPKNRFPGDKGMIPNPNNPHIFFQK
jgi:RHS repeat-associated protein